MYMARFAVRV